MITREHLKDMRADFCGSLVLLGFTAAVLSAFKWGPMLKAWLS